MKTVYRKDIRLSHMARLLRRSFACAPFSAGDLSGEVALVRMEEVRAPLVVKHGETGVRVADAGFFWLEAAPRARHWWLTAALDENGGIVQYYFDITLENDIRPGGQSSFLDLFLDVVLTPGGDVYILDRDELAAALSAGEISRRSTRWPCGRQRRSPAPCPRARGNWRRFAERGSRACGNNWRPKGRACLRFKRCAILEEFSRVNIPPALDIRAKRG